MEQFELPEGWVWDNLCNPEICILNPKKNNLKNISKSLEVTFVPMTAVDENSGTIAAPEIRKFEDVFKGYTYFSEGDVIFAKITPCMENGKSAIARNLKNGMGFGSTEFHVLRSGPKVMPEWLHAFVRNKDFRESAQANMCGGAGQQRVPTDFMKRSRILVPPMSEQSRIVSRIEIQTSRLEQIRKQLSEFERDFQETLRGVYADITKNDKYLPMSEVAPLVRRPVKVELSSKYPELGIRSFGKGTFHKPALTGTELGSKRIFRIEEGDLLFNIVFAWEGAVAVARPEDHGRVGSHRFLTCVPQKGIVTSPFLCFHFLTERGLHNLGDASPGGAGRNRTLGLKALDRIKVPVPHYEKQIWFSNLWGKMNQARQLQGKISEELSAYTPSLLAKAFRGEL